MTFRESLDMAKKKKKEEERKKILGVRDEKATGGGNIPEMDTGGVEAYPGRGCGLSSRFMSCSNLSWS